MGYCYNVLSYKGIKSEGSDKQSRHSSEKASEKSTQTTEKIPQKVPISFEWSEGGSNVVITGSFSNWEQFYPMTKSDNGHQLVIPVDPGVYQFKFIVDNQWRCSNAYPMIDDGNHNTNNVINTIQYSSFPKGLQSPEAIHIPIESKRQMSAERKTADGYSCIIPRQSELNTESPALPFHYLYSFNIDHNTNQPSLGKAKHLHINERNLLSENNSFKKILIIPHVNLNHQYLSNIKEKCIRSGVSYRNRNKFLTIIYYSSKKKG